MAKKRNPMRQWIFDRDQGICQICQKPVDPERFHVDHIIPRSHHGTNSPDNLQLAHPECNHTKKGGENRQRRQIKRMSLPDVRAAAADVSLRYLSVQDAVDTRNRLIVEKYQAGVSQADLAEAARLSPQRINQLVYDSTPEDENGTH